MPVSELGCQNSPQDIYCGTLLFNLPLLLFQAAFVSCACSAPNTAALSDWHFAPSILMQLRPLACASSDAFMVGLKVTVKCILFFV